MREKEGEMQKRERERERDVQIKREIDKAESVCIFFAENHSLAKRGSK